MRPDSHPGATICSVAAVPQAYFESLCIGAKNELTWDAVPQAEGPAVVFKSVVTFLILALVSGGSALVAFTVEHTA